MTVLGDDYDCHTSDKKWANTHRSMYPEELPMQATQTIKVLYLFFCGALRLRSSILLLV